MIRICRCNTLAKHPSSSVYSYTIDKHSRCKKISNCTYRPKKPTEVNTHCGNGTAEADKWLGRLNGRWAEPPKFGEPGCVSTKNGRGDDFRPLAFHHTSLSSNVLSTDLRVAQMSKANVMHANEKAIEKRVANNHCAKCARCSPQNVKRKIQWSE